MLPEVGHALHGIWDMTFYAVSLHSLLTNLYFPILLPPADLLPKSGIEGS
jgi:hypothetical protein